MISLIICSRNKDIQLKLRDNIEKTIGAEYELVIIDNSNHKYDIFQAYNEGVKLAHGDIFCFMHDDILYHTNKWGVLVENTFRDYPDTALLGVIGAHVVPDAPAPMWGFQHISTGRIWTEQPLRETPFDQYEALPDGGFWSGNMMFASNLSNTYVANIDGLWMCCRASCFSQIGFDESTYNGFHCYDADLSMQVLSKGWDVMVNTDLLIEHFAASIITPDYIRAAEQWYQKWKSYLPIVRGVELDARLIEVMKFYAHDARRYEESLIENRRLLNTHAYRLGKILLKPFTLLRHNKRGK